MLASLLPNLNSWRRKDMKQMFTVLILIVLASFIICTFGWAKIICGLVFPSSDLAVKSAVCPEVDSCRGEDKAHVFAVNSCKKKYQFVEPFISHKWIEFKVAIVADLDEEKSKVSGKKNTWRSFYREGTLRRNFNGKYSMHWSAENIILQSHIAEKGRGLELSELIKFDGRLLTVDDRTGIVYEIKAGKVVPWVILSDGNGSVPKGFKGEWMTVKENVLYVGGLGKEWTTPTGQLVNFNPQYVKSISQMGNTVHHNWRAAYELVKSSLGIKSPGYVIHEAVMWSRVRERWYFLPRRASHEMYNDRDDEKRATNVLISCNRDFEDFTVVKIGVLKPTHGFSSFKFVPGTNEEIIVALRTVEDSGHISTYAMIFNINGTIIMDESFIDNDKYEGIEFL